MSASKILKLPFFLKNTTRYGRVRLNTTAASARYAQAVLNLPETRVSELSNGFRIATETTDSPISTVGVWMDAGSRYESNESNGVANFFEHLAFKGTQKRSQQQLEKEVESIGAQLNSYTDREETAFYAKCLSSDVAKVVDILGDSLTNTKLDENAIEHERKVILKELDQAELNLRQVALDYLHLTAYQGTPLQKSPLGPSENIKKLTKEDISFYARNAMIGPRMVLCARGNVDHDELVKCAERNFNSLPVTYTDEIPTLKYCRFTGSDMRHREDWYPFAHVAIAIDTCGFDNPDIYSLMLAKACIGSWDKTLPSSADTAISLIQKVHKEKLFQSFESFHAVYRDTGLWGCYFVSDKMVLDDFVYELQNEWMKLCINITEAELIIAKNMLRTDLLLNLENGDHTCAEMARQILLLGKRIPFEEIDEKIQSITVQQLRDTCMKYIYDRCPAVSAVGPIEALTDYSRIRGNMYWLRY